MAQRFRDNSIVQDLEQMGVRLDGMPEAGAPTIAHVSNVDVCIPQNIDTLHIIFSPISSNFLTQKGVAPINEGRNSDPAHRRI